MTYRSSFNRSLISKYDGLKNIEMYRLPHPKWRFVRNGTDIPHMAWTDAPHGWTIRCCPTDQYEFGLPSKHRLTYKQLPNALQVIHKKTHISHFVMYPSWEFDLSGCLLISSDKVLVEVVIGDIAMLLNGHQTPDAVYSSSLVGKFHLTLISGKKDLLSVPEKSLFLNTSKKIPPEHVTVLEWTKTTEGKTLFHDLVKLPYKAGGQNL